MSGEVKEYDLSKPMGWKEFKALPIEMQEEYVKKLVEKYDISIKTFSEMAGTSNATINAYMREHPNVNRLFNSSKSYDEGRRRKRDEFRFWAHIPRENFNTWSNTSIKESNQENETIKVTGSEFDEIVEMRAQEIVEDRLKLYKEKLEMEAKIKCLEFQVKEYEEFIQFLMFGGYKPQYKVGGAINDKRES